MDQERLRQILRDHVPPGYRIKSFPRDNVQAVIEQQYFPAIAAAQNRLTETLGHDPNSWEVIVPTDFTPRQSQQSRSDDVQIFTLPAMRLQRRQLNNPSRAAPIIRTTPQPRRQLITPSAPPIHPFRPSSNATTNECPICLDEITRANDYVTECNHHYHHQCMRQMINNHTGSGQPPCPLCRHPLTNRV